MNQLTPTQVDAAELMSRRRLLRVVGLTGAVVSVAGTGVLRGSWSERAAAAVSSCVATPEVTEGPYWVDTKLHRSDVTANHDGSNPQSGVPLTLTMYLHDSSCGGVVTGAYIDIWHCNDQGVYSDEAAEGTSSENWLRGYQITDATGKVTFRTVFPGWYSGRTVHIHVRVRTYDGKTTTANYTTQLFFAEADNNAVMTTADYARSGGATRDTSNVSDVVYQQEVAEGGAVLVPLTGNVTDGYTGTVVAEFLGAGSADATVSAQLLAVHAKRVSKRHREVTVRFQAGEKVLAIGQLKRHGTVLAKSKPRLVGAGRHVLTIVVPNRVRSGPAHVVLALEDAAGNTRLIRRTVTLPD